MKKLTIGLLLLATVLPLAGQFTLKTSTEVVLVNVTARDKNDNFIKDLKAQDFTILEDGKKQEIASLDVENTDSVVTAETPQTPLLRDLKDLKSAPEKLTPTQESELKDRRLIVLFFDLSSMQPEEVERAAKSALDYAGKQMSPADLVSVVTLSNSLQVDLDFTADKEALKTTMAGFVAGSNEGFANGATADANTDTAANTDAAAGFTPDETEYNVFNTDRRLQALVTLANELSVIPQRKSVMYFSGGMERTGVENQTQLRAAINAATRANVSFYTVDVRGLEAVIPGGGAAGGRGGGGGGGGRGGGGGGGTSVYSGRGVLSQFDSNFASQETLVTLASDTGGKAFLDTNDFAPAFTKVREDTSFYYLLGYISTNAQRDGRYRRITVRLNRADLKDAKVEFRKGYYAASDFEHLTRESREQQLQEQLISEVPSTDFPVYVSTGYFRTGDNRYFVPVSVVVPGSQIPFTRASEQDRATLDVMAVIRDEGRRPFGTIRDTVKLAVNTSQEVQRKNVQYDSAFVLPPGKYNVKFVVRENQTGRMGSFEAAVNVPDLKSAPVKVSSVVLSNQKQPSKVKNNPLVRDGAEIVPNVTHVFSSGQHLYLYYEVYEAAKPLRVLTNVAFYKGAVKAYETPLVEAGEVNVPERKATAFELDVPLAELKPGFYTCQVNVVDDAAGKFVFPRLALVVR